MTAEKELTRILELDGNNMFVADLWKLVCQIIRETDGPEHSESFSYVFGKMESHLGPEHFKTIFEEAAAVVGWKIEWKGKAPWPTRQNPT